MALWEKEIVGFYVYTSREKDQMEGPYCRVCFEVDYPLQELDKIAGFITEKDKDDPFHSEGSDGFKCVNCSRSLLIALTKEQRSEAVEAATEYHEAYDNEQAAQEDVRRVRKALRDAQKQGDVTEIKRLRAETREALKARTETDRKHCEAVDKENKIMRQERKEYRRRKQNNNDAAIEQHC